jgi:hypothetical protein
MARTNVPVVRLNRTSIVTTAIASATALDNVNGNYVTNDGATFLMMFNNSGSSRTVSILLPEGADQDLTAGPRVYSLTNGVTYLTGYFPENPYGSQILVDSSGNGVRTIAYTIR